MGIDLTEIFRSTVLLNALWLVEIVRPTVSRLLNMVALGTIPILVLNMAMEPSEPSCEYGIALKLHSLIPS